MIQFEEKYVICINDGSLREVVLSGAAESRFEDGEGLGHDGVGKRIGRRENEKRPRGEKVQLKDIMRYLILGKDKRKVERGGGTQAG